MGSYYPDGHEINVTIQDGATINAFVTAVGPQGDTGIAGPPGATGATGTSLRNKGTWSSATAYVNNASYTDLVYYNGSYYACKVSNTNQVPTNTTYWDLIVSKGDTGATGPSGAGFTVTGYYPVDYNAFRVTSNTTITNGATVPITKLIGGLTVSSNLITLEKGYAYEMFIDLDYKQPDSVTGEAVIDITNTSNVSQLQRKFHKVSVYAVHAAAGSIGRGFLDLSAAASDLQVKVYVESTVTGMVLDSAFGGVYITKMKKVTI